MLPKAITACVSALMIGATSVSAGATSAVGHHGTVNVLYAASLTSAMDLHVGPSFTKTLHDGFAGYPGGSTLLASLIKSKVRSGDVFVSASPKADTALMGAANGDWVRWYATFATSPLEIAYSTKSSFAHALAHRPWWNVVTAKGFRIGRTDPVLDPKGALTVTAVNATAARTGDNAIKALLTSTTNIFPEQDLVSRVQLGALDAGFFYATEAKSASLKGISLAPLTLGATYTVTILERASNQQGAIDFITYLLSRAGKAQLSAAGITVLGSASVTGTGVPKALAGVLPTR